MVQKRHIQLEVRTHMQPVLRTKNCMWDK